MAYPLSEDALAWQRKARAFADQELLPFEETAEFNEGELPPEVYARHRRMALELGIPLMDAPRSVGGLALPLLTQTVVWEQLGRVTNALCWCMSEAQSWMFEACNTDQLKRYVLPMMRGERRECYAITEAEAGSDNTAIRTTARRDGGHYLISGEKWFVTSANKADFMFVQAVVEDSTPAEAAHALFFVDMNSPGIDMLDNPLFGHTYSSHHPTYALRGVRVPLENRIGAPGTGMDYTRSWFRRERLMIAAHHRLPIERKAEA